MTESTNTKQQIEEELERLGIDVLIIFQYKIKQNNEKDETLKYDYIAAEKISDAYNKILQICKIRKIEYFQIIDVAPVEVCYFFRR
jgi:hypothetical protein